MAEASPTITLASLRQRARPLTRCGAGDGARRRQERRRGWRSTGGVARRPFRLLGDAQPLAEKMGESFIVLIIGLRDDALDVTRGLSELDEEAKVTARDFAHSGKNVWPSSMREGVSAHRPSVRTGAKAHGVKVDAQRVGLVGHSIGGAGVLHAAAWSAPIACVPSSPSIRSTTRCANRSTTFARSKGT